MKNKIKQNKAITLIALIITIIVLLILAGVVINMTLGSNGIISKAQSAVDTYKNAQEKEEYALANIDDMYQLGNTRSVDANLKADILEIVYPVGSIYIGTTNVNPSTFIGGTWEKYAAGRTLIGEGVNGDYTFTAESTGTTVEATTNPLGEYTHQLSVEEMPSHGHGFYTDLSHSSNKSLVHDVDVIKHTTATTWKTLGASVFETSKQGETGGSESHNNIQPYIVTYMWKRVS